MNAGAVNDGSRKDAGTRKDNSSPKDDATRNGPTTSSKASGPSRKTPGPVKSAGVVPNKASEDDPRVWGDSRADNDHDAWLKEQRPPHWG